MILTIVTFGVVAGLIVAVPMFVMLALMRLDPAAMASSQALGYALMLAAFSLIVVAVKRHRDRAPGGAIKFWPAFGLGLAISAVASVVYVIGWEITLAVSGMDFIGAYTEASLQTARAKGASEAEIARLSADMAAFSAQYANPLFRLPITFIEIFPIGAVVSLIAALVLRNPRVWPARTR